MSIYEVTPNSLKALQPTDFAREGLRERTDLQRLIRDKIEVLDADLLVIGEEFGDWEDSNRRIDLLAIDREANLVVIELKRTESGGHMELQALRYAAMVSTMTFDKARDIYRAHLQKMGRDDDPESSLLEFLEWDEPDEERFALDVRVILASADFSKELTTTVMWLNQRGLDIRCVRLQPYSDGDRVLLDVQQVIPLPEAEEFQVQVREKAQRERQTRSDGRNMPRLDHKNGFIKITERGRALDRTRYCGIGRAKDEWDRLLQLSGQGESPDPVRIAEWGARRWVVRWAHREGMIERHEP